jgi:hypothetical protein
MKKMLKWTAVAVLGLTLSTPTIIAAAEAEAPAKTTVTNETGSNAGTVSVGKRDHKIVVGVEGRSSYPLPPEVLNRLSPEQILELEQSRHGSQMEEVVVPLGSFAMIVGIVALVVNFRFKRTRMVQETIRAMVEKGTPIPPELLLPPEPRRRPRSDLRSGLGWVGIGIGLLIFLSGQEGRYWALGLIPLFIGMAYLVAWKVESKKVQ